MVLIPASVFYLFKIRATSLVFISQNINMENNFIAIYLIK